jgi:hypothetical protein
MAYCVPMTWPILKWVNLFFIFEQKNGVFRGLHYKTLQIRNLQKNDKIHGMLGPSGL